MSWQINLLLLSAVTVCLIFAAKTLNRKYWFGRVCMLADFVSVYITKNYRGVRILFFLNMVLL